MIDGLADLLIGAYLTGTSTIDVTCKQPIPRAIRTEIRDFLRDTRGMEIEEDDERHIRIVSILNPSELRLQVSINRMYILISSLVNDAFEVLGGESDELLSDIQEPRAANRCATSVGRTTGGLGHQEPVRGERG